MARSTDALKWKKVKAGSLIAVYWKEYKHYFACKVLRKHSKETPKSRFFVEYEDQSKYWHNLATTKFRWLEDVGVFVDDEAEEDATVESEGETEQESDGTPPMISENENDEDDDLDTKLESNDTLTPATKQSAKKRKEISEDSAKEDHDQEASGNGNEDQDQDEDSSHQPKNKVKERKTTKSAKTGKSKSSPKGTKTALSLSMKTTVKHVKNANENKGTTKQGALLSLLMVHRMSGTNTVTYERLVKDLGCHPKTKKLAQAWKEIRQQNLVEEEGCGKGKQKLFRLTQEGIESIAPDDYKHELANPPKTTMELHERIKSHAINNHAVKIFERLLHARKEESSLSRTELAAACGVTVNTKSYACALKQLRENGYAVFDPKNKHHFVLSEKCFID